MATPIDEFEYSHPASLASVVGAYSMSRPVEAVIHDFETHGWASPVSGDAVTISRAGA